MFDYHVHTTYSDGSFLPQIIDAAERAGLDGVGFADHCNVFDADQSYRETMGFNLDLTYERRRRAIDRARDGTDLRLFDAVEMDYHADREATIESFLEDADFEYAIGSVHAIEGVNVHNEPYFADLPQADREAAVETYVEHLLSLIDSELFEIAAHVDLVERNGALRGLLTEDHYRRIAEAFADSRTVPEINAGRVLDAYGEFHPSEPFAKTLLDAGVSFTIGSDAHAPDSLIDCSDELREVREEWNLPIVELPP
ncbi:Histidinol-phosphatase (PHP family) [Halorhabdus sp. SVX81]|uniref:PHP domain-containing protein n=1 Tax=Halorhabdus sp. SVX81 TaxID=2978283 RepID=UPI0023DBECA9|nr:PHP domain-containing protein [Halorhabdus sp. SVX81]WEL17437.1 Histidinol-phosphatase (PHP family) [Halorhabdus sp. SVX81]